MSTPELTQALWRKSSRSNGQGQCVEVADLGTAIAVRDSKHPTEPALAFTRTEWIAFIAATKDGEFDR